MSPANTQTPLNTQLDIDLLVPPEVQSIAQYQTPPIQAKLPPAIAPNHYQPLERLQVSDGLLITANHWQRAHDYHRQRQKLHYQSLYHAGIIQGLGVCAIAPPSEMPAEYRDGRWIQIQPGMAMDIAGNPIIVPEAMDFRIASVAPPSGSVVVYILLRYVDPDSLQVVSGSRTPSEFVQETFRIDETITTPSQIDIVLCQVHLTAGEVTLQPAPNVFSPKLNQLDLRDRKGVQPRSQITVRVGISRDSSQTGVSPWNQLLRSLSTLYPTMAGTVQTLSGNLSQDDLSPYDLLHFTQREFVSLGPTEADAIQQAVKAGTVLFVEVSTLGQPIAQLGKLHYDLQKAIMQAKNTANASQLQADLETEFSAITQELNQHLREMQYAVQHTAMQMGLSIHEPEAIDIHHLLRHQPFLFSQFPIINEHPIYIFSFGSILLVIGDLCGSWCLDNALTMPREILRSAQEMGINLLHFAARHHHLTQLQSPPQPTAL
jgi:hypothetical protein